MRWQPPEAVAATVTMTPMKFNSFKGDVVKRLPGTLSIVNLCDSKWALNAEQQTKNNKHEKKKKQNSFASSDLLSRRQSL